MSRSRTGGMATRVKNVPDAGFSRGSSVKGPLVWRRGMDELTLPNAVRRSMAKLHRSAWDEELLRAQPVRQAPHRRRKAAAPTSLRLV